MLHFKLSSLVPGRPLPARRGNSPVQMVTILAVTVIVLFAVLKLWGGTGGEDQGLRGEVQARLESVISGETTPEDGSSDGGKPGGDGNAAGNDPQPPEPPPTLTDAERRKVAELRNLARRLGGMANLAGNEIESTRLTAMADAALLAAAAILGPEHLKTEIAAIAARRTVEATANALLKAIENRVPITRIVKLPILDGLGQLTGDFVHWWREHQTASNMPASTH